MDRDYSADMYYLGDQIRKIREEQKVSQEELAERLDISTITIHRIENGIRQPSVETLFRFSDTMNVPLPVLFPIRMQNNGTGDLAAVYGKLSPANQKIVCETLNTLMKGLLATQS